jgi:LuxR family transcriptional regulator, maltose regulon positive regulatory protein
VSRETGTDAQASGSGVESSRESLPLHGTKIHAPRRHRATIRRARLTDVLRAARPSPVLVVAPAGFGKTSLLADWAAIDGRPFAWLSLGQPDNDRMVLWAYIAAALTAVGGTTWTGDQVSSIARTPDPVEVVLANLTPDQDLVLVLDDYHLIESEACHDSVLRFIDLAPANLQVAISSRTAIPLPLGRHRASGTLVELGSSDLRFTTEESAAFLNGSLGLGLDDRSVTTLTERTEGWPAGLYLAYLSLRRAKDRKAFIDAFGARDRLVGEYLTEQVLTALGPADREFMLMTAVVDEVNGSLADVMTGTNGSAARLVELERANVFITPLDERREWYRYHHLLLELLRLELANTKPGTHHDLHVRAATWFEAAGDADRAIHHAIEGDDADRAARLISASYLQALEWGRIESVMTWLDRVGDERIRTDARLSIVKAWVMHFMGLHAEGEAALADAMASSYVGVLPDGASSIEASAALMGAAFPGGDIGSMLANARRAFELESRPPSPWRTTVHVLLGFALVRDGSFAEADRYLELGSELATRSDSWMDAVGARSLRGRVAMHAGDPSSAERFAREAVDLADTHGVAPTASGAFARVVLGGILAEVGQVAEGAALLEATIPAIRIFREPVAVADSLLELTRARQMLGQRAEAIRSFEEADAIVDGMTDPGYLAITRRGLARELFGPSQSLGEPLSARERDVLRLLADGLSKREVAGQLFVSYNTVHSHVRAIYRKLGVTSRADAVDRARKQGILG